MKAVKEKNGKWRARGYNKFTGERPSFTAHSRAEAEQLARAYTFSVESSLDIDVGTACDSYIMNREKVLSENTIKDYKTTRRLHLTGIDKRPIKSLTSETLQAWVNSLADDGLAPKSIKNMYSFVKAAIKAQGVTKELTATLPQKIKPKVAIPSEADLRIILDAVKDTELECPVRLALSCCMRRGEVAALLHHPECIYDTSVEVRYNMIKANGKWKFKAPKNYTSYRMIPCPAELTEMARSAKRLNPGEITDKWIKMRKKLGMKYRFHDLRHASASMMASAGIPAVDIERFGGWQHGSPVLQAIYTHNVEESLKRSADLWQAKMSELGNLLTKN